jgi:hypothetical protein
LLGVPVLTAMQFWTRGTGSPEAVVEGAAGEVVHQFIDEDPAQPLSAITNAHRTNPGQNRFAHFLIMVSPRMHCAAGRQWFDSQRILIRPEE